MITNLLASIVVTLVTNVTSSHNGVQSPFRDTWTVGEPSPGSWIKVPDEKTEIESVVEVRKLEFEIEGRKHSVELSQKEVERTVNTYRLEQKWKLVSVDTGVMKLTFGAANFSDVLTNIAVFRKSTNYLRR